MTAPQHRDTRSAVVIKLLKNHPTRIPVLVHRHSPRDPDIDQHRFLASHDMSIAGFSHTIRQRIHVNAQTAIFIFVNGTIFPQHLHLSDLYHIHQASDGFLYINYALEAVYG